MGLEYFTPKEVAQRLRVKATTVRQWIRSGVLEAEKIQEGKRHRYHIKSVTIETIETPTYIVRNLQHSLPGDLSIPTPTATNLHPDAWCRLGRRSEPGGTLHAVYLSARFDNKA